ncbi:hypothetical protein AVEN_47873-1 [Araneus ventricosus]|uniref:Uncharacterized protein n=1 Tax=Araneus ventricosus TaxID=182803 RepID=A0A4Y2UI77_ARAVE|nr:hypothetical protein AVEN_47873-1 [Araneus ventricosus]
MSHVCCDDPAKKAISLPLVPHQVFEAYCQSCSLVIRMPKNLKKKPTALQPRSYSIRLSPFSCNEASTIGCHLQSNEEMQQTVKNCFCSLGTDF